jgi:hypothetical protein
MTYRNKLPVEPLSDAAWNRIEAGVFNELDQRAAGSAAPVQPARRERSFGLALGLVAIAQVAAVALFMVIKADHDKHAAASTDGSTRLVAREQATDALLGDISVHMEPASALVAVGDIATHSLVVLERGAAQFSVPTRGARPAFVVQTGEVRVEVVGTRFRVERLADSARVDTFEGVVRVTVAGHSTLVRHGERWISGKLTTGGTSEAAPAVQSDRPVPAGAPLPTETKSGSLDAPAATADTPKQAVASARDKHNGPPIRPSKATPRVAQAQTDREAFERAATLEAADPKQALRIYLQLAAGHGGWGANALYAAARLELELGSQHQALQTLQHYIRRYPNGANRSDAHALIEKLTIDQAASHDPEGSR